MRSFRIAWQGTGGIEEPSDVTSRIMTHRFLIEFYYSVELNDDDIHNIVSSDRNDIIKLLRDTDSYNGTSSTEQTTNIGLYSRKLKSDELDNDGDVWIYSQSWECVIMESEL
jgi:hypothetical protein